MEQVVILAPSLNRAVIQAIKIGRTMSADVHVVHVSTSREEGERTRDQIERQVPGIPVVLVESTYRTLIRPLVRYLDVLQSQNPDPVLVVLIPEYVPRHWWDRLLYNQNAERIKAALVGRRDRVVLDVPYRRSD